MTPQEIFDKVAAHLLNQKEKSTQGGPTGRCAYRGDNGNKCAVGVLIPDEVYVPEMEGRGVRALMDGFEDVLPSYFADNLILLSELQCLHDSRPTDRYEVARRLRGTAVYFGLSTAAVAEWLREQARHEEAQQAQALQAQAQQGRETPNA